MQRSGAVRLLGAGFWLVAALAFADEPGLSPFLPKITGHEDFLYVWTRGVEGLGDGNDKLVTIAVHPGHARYGAVLARAPLEGRHETHALGLTDDRRQLWVGSFDQSTIFVFELAADPAKPKLVRTIDDFAEKSGAAGPRSFCALPGRMLITAGPEGEDDGRAALVEYANDGTYLQTTWLPNAAEYGWETRVSLTQNRMLSSTFSARANLKGPLAAVLADAEVRARFGETLVLWDFLARKPLQVLDVPGAPLALRWALGPRHSFAFTATALSARLWGIFQLPDGSFQDEELSEIGDPALDPLPVDLSLSADDQLLFATTLRDGHVRVFDVSDPHNVQQIHERRIGASAGRIAQSWDGKRVYFTSSFASAWDAAGAEQFVRAFRWNGRELESAFELDFRAAKLGRPGAMRLGQLALYGEGAEPVSTSTRTRSP